MSPGPQESPILSSSPRSIHGSTHSPVRHRTGSIRSNGSDHEGNLPQRHSPTLTRSFNPHAPDVRERQRTMDADMAMQLSRARRDTESQPGRTSPIAVRRRSSDDRQPTFSPYGDSDSPYPNRPQPDPALSFHEEEEEVYQHPVVSVDELDPRGAFPHSPHAHLSMGHDPSLLVSNRQINVGIDPIETEVDHSMGGLPMYQPNTFQLSRTRFDFSAMEEYAKEEKTKLGVSPPKHGNGFLSSSPDGAEGSSSQANMSTPFSIPPRRLRERKLSSSNAVSTRRGKMALFEQSINAGAMSSLGGHSRTSNGPHITIPASLPERSIPSSSEHLPALPTAAPGNGHDRPYRFSFYSNALAATIHSRSLGELPAEGQSFEDLFSGMNFSAESEARPGIPIPKSGVATPRANGKGDGPDFAPRMGFPSNGNRDGHGADSELSTWWLDVTSPTDEEMKMLSKVHLAVFGDRQTTDDFSRSSQFIL